MIYKEKYLDKATPLFLFKSERPIKKVLPTKIKSFQLSLFDLQKRCQTAFTEDF